MTTLSIETHVKEVLSIDTHVEEVFCNVVGQGETRVKGKHGENKD